MVVYLWKVGELARRTGLSIRTLHHYDALGLLSPTRRSETGYRLYTPADVARLQQIVSLRELGLSLEEIRTLLDDPAVSPLHVVELHLERIREQMVLQRDLAARLESIATRLAAAEEVSVEDLFHIMEVMSTMERITSYYTPEQLQALEQRRHQLGEEEIRRVERAWPELIAKVQAEMERGTDPADARVQELAREWQGLVEEFTGGDPGITESLRTMYRSEPEVSRQAGLNSELFAYISKAMTAMNQ